MGLNTASEFSISEQLILISQKLQTLLFSSPLSWCSAPRPLGIQIRVHYFFPDLLPSVLSLASVSWEMAPFSIQARTSAALSGPLPPVSVQPPAPALGCSPVLLHHGQRHEPLGAKSLPHLFVLCGDQGKSKAYIGPCHFPVLTLPS